jgi:putative membrane protein
MTTRIHVAALSAAALTAVLSLAACKDRSERVAAQPGNTDSSMARTKAPTAGGVDASPASAPGETIANQPSAAISGTAATAALPAPDIAFVTKAAESGRFEVEVGKLALEKATDPAIKAFARMLVDDHTAANDKLRQIASGHQLPLPAALPEDKKRELEQLGKLSGAEFDRRFVKMVGIGDHRHDIGEFEKAGQTAQSPDVKRFAETTLTTLKKHLEAAQRLPGAG